METKIRLAQIEAIPNEQRLSNTEITLNIFREPYKDITAYFIRNRNTILLFVNSNLKVQDQANAIKIIKKQITQCPIISMGLIDKAWNYKCNSVSCQYKCNGICHMNDNIDPVAF